MAIIYDRHEYEKEVEETSVLGSSDPLHEPASSRTTTQIVVSEETYVYCGGCGSSCITCTNRADVEDALNRRRLIPVQFVCQDCGLRFTHEKRDKGPNPFNYTVDDIRLQASKRAGPNRPKWPVVLTGFFPEPIFCSHDERVQKAKTASEARDEKILVGLVLGCAVLFICMGIPILFFIALV